MRSSHNNKLCQHPSGGVQELFCTDLDQAIGRCGTNTAAAGHEQGAGSHVSSARQSAAVADHAFERVALLRARRGRRPIRVRRVVSSKIVVLDGGRIVAEGRHTDLLAEIAYARLWQTQAGGS